MQLQLGTAKLDITPKQPVSLAGFSSRKHLGPFTGVSQRLYSRLFLFQTVEGTDKQATLLISADLIWWGSDRVLGLKHKINKRYGIPEANIILHATHTHSGPQTSGMFTSYVGEMNESYVRELEETILSGIQEAVDGLEETVVEQGKGSCSISINRRLTLNGKVELLPNPEGITDPEVTVIRFRKPGGEVKAMLVHFTCHPTITNENLVSSEFTGVAMELIEQSLGDGVVSGYLQGFCGDINPAKDGTFGRGTNEQVVERGQTLAAHVLDIVNQPMEPLLPRRIDVRSSTVMLPLQTVPTRDELMRLKDEPGVTGEWSSLLLASQPIRHEIPLDMSLVTISDNLSFLTVNCEIVVEYGLWVKRNFGVLPVAYCNGMFGYIPTAKQLEEGGYEPRDSVPYFALPAPFRPEVESLIRKAMTDLIMGAGC